MNGSRFPWEAVTAICAASTLVSAIAIYMISAIVERKLGGFLSKLDRTFARKDLADERHTDHSRRIEVLERRGAGA